MKLFENNNIEIYDYTGESYEPTMNFGAWRVAFMNYADELEKLNKYERHLETDEVFVLIKGEASLFIGEERERYDMEIGKFYNVKKNAWHSMSMTENSIVLIVENDNTGLENTEYMPINKN